ncbi:MAG TPA: hypothetical protein VG271_04520 [Beijerinckiaceae bacterium]|nr:hypothetical protein [Beijerinckiaceae bacterium]
MSGIVEVDAMKDVFIYAGANRWGGGGSQTAKPDTLGGVFRLRLGDNSWRHMMSGFPEVVHVHCIVVHPDDPSVVFCGTHESIYRSSDFGETWTAMIMEPMNRQIWSISFDPQNRSRMYAGASPSGIYRSDDGGRNWREVPTGRIPDRLSMGTFKNRVMRIAVDPVDSNKICAGLEVNGAASSEDGGDHWVDRSDSLMQLASAPNRKSRILTDSDEEGMLDVHAVCISPVGDRPAFLANRMGIFTSTDNGRSWSDLEVGRWSEYTYGRDVRASVCEPGVVYAALSVSSQGSTGSVARSDDHGNSWTRIDRDVNVESTVTSVAQHPSRPEIIFFAARRGQVFGTENGGRTWQSYPLPSGVIGVYAVTCA